MTVQIIKGIQLPAFDVEMLSLGKLIVVPFRQYIPDNQELWLYPSQTLPDNLSLEQYYQPEYLTQARSSFAQYEKHPIQLKTWARCEFQWRINPDQKHRLANIAKSTVWNLTALEHIFEQYKVLKLLILRVYRLSNPCTVNVPTEPGYFYWPTQSEDIITMGSQSDTPIVSEVSFNKRKALLLAGEDFPDSGLEALQAQVEQISLNNPAAKALDQEIKIFLGWSEASPKAQPDPNLAWIDTIAQLGNRSKEEDVGKSNYQAGTDFEIAVRNSLEFLGFTIDYAHRGGAGGLDLFCSKPYALVGECKAGRKIPNDTAVQLLNLGTLRLKDEQLLKKTAKLIIGPGEPTPQLEDAAKVHNMAIINPETLEKLVKLQSKYPGSVDLFKLKEYLKPGKSDSEVEKYIQQVFQQIKLRVYLVKFVKDYLKKSQAEKVVFNQLHGGYVYSTPPDPLLNREQLHEVLIELSSPLTGYLGREEANDWQNDCFYFLREMPAAE
ncbi:MAG: DUF1802 family protein [Microcoleus vaginatus WJT46-NPBG5]|jgi:hypothetical protein|nr:DUF1802 family protein [Microcoleus vaginatus WJT46-NPBG5]